MRLNWRLAGISFVLLPLLALAGCAGDSVIVPGNGQVGAQMLLDPVVGPREGSSPPFVYARAEVAAVTFVPTDPLGEISLGPFPLQILEQGALVDMTQSVGQVLGQVNIGIGEYRMEKIFINRFKLNTSDEPPVPNFPVCEDGVLKYAEFLITGSGDERGIVPTNQPVFDVEVSGTKTLVLLLDGTALTTILESHVSCDPATNVATVTPLTAAELGSLFSVEWQ